MCNREMPSKPTPCTPKPTPPTSAASLLEQVKNPKSQSITIAPKTNYSRPVSENPTKVEVLEMSHVQVLKPVQPEPNEHILVNRSPGYHQVSQSANVRSHHLSRNPIVPTGNQSPIKPEDVRKSSDSRSPTRQHGQDLANANSDTVTKLRRNTPSEPVCSNVCTYIPANFGILVEIKLN